MSIRYDKKLNSEINKSIRNFNQKIERLQKTERDLILPDKISKKELKKSVYTRSELYRKMSELKRFSKRGSEETITLPSGVRTSLWDLDKLRRDTRRAKLNLTKDLKRLEETIPTVFGKKQHGTLLEMGDTHLLNLRARRDALNKKISELNQEDFTSYKKLVNRINKNRSYLDNIFKDSYSKMLTDLGYFIGYDKEKLKMLKNRLMELDTQKFIKLFETEKAISSITDYYPLMTKTLSQINPEDIKVEVTELYDNLIDNLDEILKDYA